LSALLISSRNTAMASRKFAGASAGAQKI